MAVAICLSVAVLAKKNSLKSYGILNKTHNRSILFAVAKPTIIEEFLSKNHFSKEINPLPFANETS